MWIQHPRLIPGLSSFHKRKDLESLYLKRRLKPIARTVKTSSLAYVMQLPTAVDQQASKKQWMML